MSKYFKGKKSIYMKLLRICLFCGSIILLLLGIFLGSFNTMLMGSVLMLASNLVLSLEKIKLRMILFLYNCMVFLFLMGRPVLGMVQGTEWYEIGTTSSGMFFAVASVFILLFSLHIGTIVFTKNDIRLMENAEKGFIREKTVFELNLQLVTLILFCIAFLCSCMEGLEKIVFMRTHTYIEYYSTYKTTQPAIVKAFIQTMLPSMYIFLATMPSKKKAILVLGCYVLSTIPSLMVGMRSPTMLSLLFVFVYFFIRNVFTKKNEKKWLGKKEIAVIIISIPVAIVFLFSYMYIRNDISLDSAQISNPFLGFFHQQGNTFDVLAKSYDVIPDLPDVGFPGYFFGPIYDKVTQSLLIRTLFDIPQASGQTPEFLAVAHDSKVHLSYLIMGNDFFLGHGVGTSSILDAFIDFRWVGIAALGFLIGIYLKKTTFWIHKHWMIGAIILSTIANTFYSPRANAVDTFGQLFNLYFWIVVVICSMIAFVLTPITYREAGNSFKSFTSKYLKMTKE